jgi:hypothetical protein
VLALFYSLTLKKMTEDEDAPLVIEVEEEKSGTFLKHCRKVLKNVSQDEVHFDCNYYSTFLKHLRSTHPKKCPEFLSKENTNKPVRNFFCKTSMKESFGENVFMGKLFKWIVKKDQPLLV